MSGSGAVDRSRPIGAALAKLAGRPASATLALLGLCLVTFLPGVLHLPPVDRTEVIYAETTRAMVARGAWLDPRYGDTVHPFRPIGTYWVQGATAAAAGRAHDRDIRVYRLPGLAAVTLTVLALYWLALPLVGGVPALVAAGLLAVAPLTVLLAELAITEGLALLPATVAMLALLRLYAGDEGKDRHHLALVFWVAVGGGMLLNAMQTPILIFVTVITLFAFDRDLSWLKRTHPLLGIPLALAIAAPWLIVRVHQDGVPFAGLTWNEFLAALGGSQDMKLRAFPGTFVAAAALGFLPGTALLVPAVVQLWTDRDQRLARFLFAWIAGYLIYLEALSSKPGTYTVQVMFAAFALAVARLIAMRDGALPLPKGHLIPPPVLAASFAIALFAIVAGFSGYTPSFAAIACIGAVAVLFGASAKIGRQGHLTAWAVTGVGALALFAVTLLAVVLPSLDRFWPARQLERAFSGCSPGPRSVLGFREPTSAFRLQSDHARQSPETLADQTSGIVAVEDRWRGRYLSAVAKRGHEPPVALGCVTAFNVMRGCPLSFTLYGTNKSVACALSSESACRTDTDKAINGSLKSDGCD